MITKMLRFSPIHHPIVRGFVAVGVITITSPPVLSQVLEEVTVTAQKRNQSMQDVPVAVTAYTGEDLQQGRISDVADLSVANPSFTINVQHNKVSNSPAHIRGVGTTGTNAAFEGAVGLYVDGVYRSRPGMVMSTFNDIGSLEILRGPQGTLFGKNTSAGALVLASNSPTFEFDAGLEANLGNYHREKFSGYVNGPVTDTLALRFAAISNQRDGYFDNPFTGNNTQNIDTQSYKLQALFEPVDRWSARLIADYSESDERCCYSLAGRYDPEGDFENPLDQLYSTFTNGAPYFNETGDAGNRRNVNNVDGTDETEDWGLSLDLHVDLTDSMQLRSITSYREYQNEQSNGDWDFGPADFGADFRQLFSFKTFTQEFNFTGAWQLGETNVDYVLGAFYSNEDLDHIVEMGVGEFLGENWQIAFADTPLAAMPADVLARPGTFFNNADFDHKNEVYALFGHFTFVLSDSWNMIAGIRYSDETKELDRKNLLAENNLDMLNYMLSNQLGFLGLGATFPGPDNQFELSDDETTFTLGLQYFLDDDTQTYLTYSKGYKAGGISLSSDAGGNLVSVDNLVNILQGTPPTTSEDVILGPSADAIYEPETVDSFELGVKTQYLGGRGRLNTAIFYSEFENIQSNTFTGTSFLAYNADTAEVAGVELENTYRHTDNLSSVFSVTWLERAKFGDEPNAIQPNIIGRDLEHAPQWAAYIGLDYERSLSANITGFANMGIAYKGKHFLSNDGGITDEYTLVGASIGLRLLGDALEIALSCQNCSDEDYLTSTFTQPFHFNNPAMVNVGSPRVLWGTIRYYLGDFYR
jgi:iron complex outermembrane recepter protein